MTVLTKQIFVIVKLFGVIHGSCVDDEIKSMFARFILEGVLDFSLSLTLALAVKRLISNLQ